MVVAIAACGARTPLFVDEADETEDGGASDGAVAVDAPIDSPTHPPPDATVDASVDGAIDAPLDATVDVLVDVTVSPVDGAVMPRIVFVGSEGSYGEDALLAFLASYPASVARDLNTGPVTAASFAAYDIVILDQLTRTFDPTEAAALATWVQEGGSVMSLSGFANGDLSWQQPNTLLAGLPFQYDGTLYNDGPCPGDVTDFAPHPLTIGLANVPFCGGYGVPFGGSCAGPTQSIADIDGDSVAAACDEGIGRVYIWGDDWVEYPETWDAGLDTQQFWQDAIDWLAHRD
jgi:hypothetical protein